jgi:hypothetical protein
MNTLDAALYWAAKGFRVFPLAEHSKIPATANGLHDATCSPEVIKRWFRTGRKNVGIQTGATSKLIVIDIDIKAGKDGKASLYQHFKQEFLLPEGRLIFKTPSGGFHIPVCWRDAIDVGNAVNVLGLQGVDIRGNGGYIVAPPSSLLIDNKPVFYRCKSIDLPVTTDYGWITTLLTQHKVGAVRSSFDPSAVMAGVASGQRNSTLFSYARHLCARGFDKGMVLGFVTEAARRCLPPLPDAEVIRIIDSAFMYKEAKPSDIKPTIEGLL